MHLIYRGYLQGETMKTGEKQKKSEMKNAVLNQEAWY